MADKLALGINASPHPRGNTARLVEEVLRGAETKGYSTKNVCLGDLGIHPLEDGGQEDPYQVRGPDDDMNALIGELQGMDAFVFGSPIYFDHITAQGKIFIDRLLPFSSGKLKGTFPVGVPAVILTTYEWDKATAYDDVLEWTKGRFEDYFKMKVVASIAAEGTSDRPVADRPELLAKAMDAGKLL
jgi:multimeric flavodoxin WrbA